MRQAPAMLPPGTMQTPTELLPEPGRRQIAYACQVQAKDGAMITQQGRNNGAVTPGQCRRSDGMRWNRGNYRPMFFPADTPITPRPPGLATCRGSIVHISPLYVSGLKTSF